MLVGNKSDLNDSRQVKLEEATQWAQNNQIGFYETSALDSNNIEHAFQTLAERTSIHFPPPPLLLPLSCSLMRSSECSRLDERALTRPYPAQID